MSPAFDSDDSISVTSTVVEEYDPKKAYQVESVLAEKTSDIGREFFVKWENYDESWNSWEPLENFDGTPAIEEWDRQKQKIDTGVEEPFSFKHHRKRVAAINKQQEIRKKRREAKRAKLAARIANDDLNDSDYEEAASSPPKTGSSSSSEAEEAPSPENWLHASAASRSTTDKTRRKAQPIILSSSSSGDESTDSEDEPLINSKRARSQPNTLSAASYAVPPKNRNRSGSSIFSSAPLARPNARLRDESDGTTAGVAPPAKKKKVDTGPARQAAESEDANMQRTNSPASRATNNAQKPAQPAETPARQNRPNAVHKPASADSTQARPTNALKKVAPRALPPNVFQSSNDTAKDRPTSKTSDKQKDAQRPPALFKHISTQWHYEKKGREERAPDPDAMPLIPLGQAPRPFNPRQFSGNRALTTGQKPSQDADEGVQELSDLTIGEDDPGITVDQAADSRPARRPAVLDPTEPAQTPTGPIELQFANRSQGGQSETQQTRPQSRDQSRRKSDSDPKAHKHLSIHTSVFSKETDTVKSTTGTPNTASRDSRPTVEKANSSAPETRVSPVAEDQSRSAPDFEMRDSDPWSASTVLQRNAATSHHSGDRTELQIRSRDTQPVLDDTQSSYSAPWRRHWPDRDDPRPVSYNSLVFRRDFSGIALFCHLVVGGTIIPVTLTNLSNTAKFLVLKNVKNGENVHLHMSSLIGAVDFQRLLAGEGPVYHALGPVLPRQDRTIPVSGVKDALRELRRTLEEKWCGAILFHRSFTLLVYPASHAAWQRFDGRLKGVEQTDLRFILLVPVSPLPVARNGSSLEREPYKGPHSLSTRRVLIKYMLGIDVQSVLHDEHDRAVRSVFLIYPEDARTEHDVLTSALRRLGHSVWTSQVSGHWQHFLSLTAGKSGKSAPRKDVERGVVLVHRLFTQFRAIPRLWRALSNQVTIFQAPDMNTSEDTPMELFPRKCGRAILLLDSCFIRDLEGVLKILLWFDQASKSQPWATSKLLVRPHVHSWLRDVAKNLIDLGDLATATIWLKVLDAVEKLVPSNALCQSYDYQIADWRNDPVLLSFSRDTCPSLHWDHPKREPGQDIDGLITTRNDEALFEWFGAWSLEEIRRYRRFVVLSGHPAGQAFDQDKQWMLKWNFFEMWPAQEFIKHYTTSVGS